MKRSCLLTTAGLFALSACSTTPSSPSAEAGVPYGIGAPAQLFPAMGPHTRQVSTDSAEAQRYFDQALNWMYAFNHDEAVRSFTRAAELDPDFAMAWWGVSLCQGPNYNDPQMTDARSAAAWEALQEALATIDNTTPVERALIEALQSRYAAPWPADRRPLEEAYADAMRTVHASHPDDPDVATLYAESVMMLNPWDLYTRDKEPRERTGEVEQVLERVLAAHPRHPGANHLYIHAVEPSSSPERGIPAANRLSDLVQSSGHLEHMPSHIYVQVGMWDRAVVQNQKAMRADAEYRARSPEQGLQYMYMTHNSHMLAFAGMMSGREQEALDAARAMWRDIPGDVLPQVAPFVDVWMCAVYDVLKRFGRWDQILDEPAPPDYMPVTTAVWRAARAVAYAAKKDFDGARREHRRFRETKATIPQDLMWGPDPAHTVLQCADHFIGAEILLQSGDYVAAAAELERGIEVEDSLAYGEPPNWLQPIRHTLGAVYLANGRPADAERVYREDLEQWPGNGWSLFGLGRALEAQGQTAEAAAVRGEFDVVWQHADAPTDTSCKCIPGALLGVRIPLPR